MSFYAKWQERKQVRKDMEKLSFSTAATNAVNKEEISEYIRNRKAKEYEATEMRLWTEYGRNNPIKVESKKPVKGKV